MPSRRAPRKIPNLIFYITNKFYSFLKIYSIAAKAYQIRVVEKW
jgi:hypothetical protein